MAAKMISIAGVLADSIKIVGLPAHEYHADIGVQSCGLLKPMLTSPAHYKSQFFDTTRSSKAKDFGTLIHTLVLEPASFAARYIVYPGVKDGRDSKYKAFVEKHAGRIVIDDVSLQLAHGMAERILERRFRGRAFREYIAEGQTEVTIHYTDPSTKIRCRVRIDLLHPEFIFDLKTALSVMQSDFLRQAVNLHYDMQSYMYSLAECLWAGREVPLPFVFVAAENTAPHSVSAFTAGATLVGKGGRKYQDALGAYAACSAVNHWPDLGSEDTLELEHWMATSAANESTWRAQLATP